MRIVLIGPPGCDDTSWADRLAEKFSLLSLAVPDLVREAISAGTPAGIQAREEQEAGQPVSDETMIEILLERLEQADAANGFVLHSWPRTLRQAELLDYGLQKSQKQLHGVVQLKVDLDIMVQRITGRRVCTSCGYVHNVFTNPPSMDGQCDMCGGNLRHRADDREETFETRMRFFEQHTLPVIDYYRQTERLQTVEVIGDPDHVWQLLVDMVEQLGSTEPKLVVSQIEPKVTMRELEAKVFGGMEAGEGGEPAAADATRAPLPVAEAPPAKETASSKRAVKKEKTGKKTASKKKAVVKKVPAKKKVTAKKTAVKKKAPVKKKVAARKVGVKKKTAVKKKVAAKKKVTAKKTAVKKKAPVKKKAVAKKKVVAKKKAQPGKKAVAKKKIAVKKKAQPKKKVAAKKATTKKKAAAKKKRR